MNVLMLDGSCPRPYAAASLRAGGLGGSEATVLRVAEALGAFVCQHNRDASEGRYLSLADAVKMRFDAVVSVRLAASVSMAAKCWPRARQLLWLHDLEPPKLRERRELLQSAAVTVVCVSDFHANLLREAVPGRLARIYNPIDDALAADATAVDRNQLLFCSTPAKGLGQALQLFARARAAEPGLRLYVANPGYFEGAGIEAPGVVALGALPHAVLMQHMRRSLCVFYPNTIFPETFGLVFAEANAVGTPVLAHDFGAAREVLGPGEQVMDARDGERFIERVLAWREGARPRVAANPAFRVSALVQEWRALLSPQATG